MEKKYSIPNIDCSACAIAIEAALEDVKGVKKAEVHVIKREVEVEFDEQSVAEPSVRAALTDAGYPPSGEARPEGGPPA